MKKSMKTSLIIIVLALIAGLAGFVWLGSRSLSHGPGELVVDSVSDTSRGPAFEVHVVVPRSARPLAGILPDWLVKKLDNTPSELQFNHNNPGARIGRVSKDHLELSADGWELLIQIDSEGRASFGMVISFGL